MPKKVTNLTEINPALVQALKAQGLTNHEIAKKLGIDDYELVLDALRNQFEIVAPNSIDDLRAQLRQQFLRLFNNAVRISENPLTSDSNKINAINSAARILGQIALLEGANAPIQVDTRLTGNIELHQMTGVVLTDPKMRESALDFLRQFTGAANSESNALESGGTRLLSEPRTMGSNEISGLHQRTIIEGTLG